MYFLKGVVNKSKYIKILCTYLLEMVSVHYEFSQHPKLVQWWTIS